MERLRILLLEDSPLDAELVLTRLMEDGVASEAVRVETRADYLAELERDRFDLILADYSLPSFDGGSALAIARERCPEVPFIFVSGALGEELAIETLKDGATDYVLKDRLERLVPSIQRARREAEERADGGVFARPGGALLAAGVQLRGEATHRGIQSIFAEQLARGVPGFADPVGVEQHAIPR